MTWLEQFKQLLPHPHTPHLTFSSFIFNVYIVFTALKIWKLTSYPHFVAVVSASLFVGADETSEISTKINEDLVSRKLNIADRWHQQTIGQQRQLNSGSKITFICKSLSKTNDYKNIYINLDKSNATETKHSRPSLKIFIKILYFVYLLWHFQGRTHLN